MIGELSGLLSAFTWALVSVLLRHLQDRTNALSLNALRGLFATLVALLAVAATGRLGDLSSFSTSAYFYLATSVIAGMGIGDTLYFYSLRHIGIVRGLLLSNSYPILTAIVAAALLGEPITAGLLAGTLLVVLGVILVLIPSRALKSASGQSPKKKEGLGIVLALMAAVCWATATSLAKIGVQEVDGLSATTVRLAVGTAFLLSAGKFSGSGLQLREYRGKHLALTILGGVVSAVCSLTFILAVQFSGAAKTATLTSTAPLFGVPMSLLMGEKLTWQILIGSMVSVLGIWLVIAG